MTKRTALPLAAFSASGLLTLVLCLGANLNSPLSLVAGDTPSIISISSLDDAVELDDNPSWKQLSVKNNLFDFLGVNPGEGINIAQKQYGAYTYKGLAYNRSIINGFESLTVDYSGSDLYVTFTQFLMEDMTFVEDNAHLVTSGSTINVNPANGYFVLYTSGETNISSLEVAYACDASLDASILFDDSITPKYARSVPKSYSFEHDLITIENNPLADRCNYSTAEFGSTGKPGSWYRWNGLDLSDDRVLPQQFSLHTTIIGNISYMIDETKFFHYSVWPQLNQKSKKLDNSGWSYAYIGNDNYEPLGKDSPDRIHEDSHGDYSYAGRFFGVYSCLGGNVYEFVDPDETDTLSHSGVTLREAYQTFTLPFWHVEFRFNGDIYQTVINGFMVDQDTMFDDGELVAEECFYMRRLELHLVNYGAGENLAGTSYTGTFTTPRIVL